MAGGFEFEEDLKSLTAIFCDNEKLKRINDVSCTAGSSMGDNYMSVVKRVLINGQDVNDKDVRIEAIVKRQIPSRSRRQLYRCDEAFTNEINAYNYVVPMLDKKANIFPQCYFAGKDKNGEMIVLEDLKEYGFAMKNRLHGLDFLHCQLVMKKLASLHASSITVKTLNENVFSQRRSRIREIVYCNEAADFYRGLMETSIQESLSSLRISNVDGSLSEPIRLIELLQTKLFYKVQDYMTMTPSKEKYNVICHGDLWVNNLMFKTNPVDGKPSEVKFIDLQAMRYTSPVFDILHFIYTSTKRDLRDNHLDMILEIYTKSLLENLETHLLPDNQQDFDLVKDQYSLDNITNQFYSHILYGLAICMWVLPAVTFDPNNLPNLDQISEISTSVKDLKCTQKLTSEYHSRIKDIALEFYQNGYLNI